MEWLLLGLMFLLRKPASKIIQRFVIDGHTFTRFLSTDGKGTVTNFRDGKPISEAQMNDAETIRQNRETATLDAQQAQERKDEPPVEVFVIEKGDR